MLTLSLGGYKWYQTQTLGDVPARMLTLKGVDRDENLFLIDMF